MEYPAERLGLSNFLAMSIKDLYERGRETSGIIPSASVYARGLAACLNECSDPVNVVGWSTGGVISIETFSHIPEKCARLVLLSSTPKFCADETFPHGTPPAVVRAMMTGVRRNPEKTLADFISRAGRPLRLEEEQKQEFAAEAVNQGREILVHGLKYLQASDFRTRIKQVQCPCLVIHGRRDRIIPWQAAQWLDDSLPQCRLLLYPRGGHLLLAQHGNQIVPEIAEFLQFPGHGHSSTRDQDI